MPGSRILYASILYQTEYKVKKPLQFGICILLALQPLCRQTALLPCLQDRPPVCRQKLSVITNNEDWPSCRAKSHSMICRPQWQAWCLVQHCCKALGWTTSTNVQAVVPTIGSTHGWALRGSGTAYLQQVSIHLTPSLDSAVSTKLHAPYK